MFKRPYMRSETRPNLAAAAPILIIFGHMVHHEHETIGLEAAKKADTYNTGNFQMYVMTFCLI